MLKSGNNANIDANQKLFYQHTVLPILNQFCSAFRHFFNGGIQITADKMSIPALRPEMRTEATYYAQLVNTGIMTPNEARKGLRLPKIEKQDGIRRFPKLDNNDNIRIPQNITGSATDATQGGRPPQESEISNEEERADER